MSTKRCVYNSIWTFRREKETRRPSSFIKLEWCRPGYLSDTLVILINIPFPLYHSTISWTLVVAQEPFVPLNQLNQLGLYCCPRTCRVLLYSVNVVLYTSYPVASLLSIVTHAIIRVYKYIL